jgi:3-hydroxyacyl-[acyl-carrier protein] dehydratase/trans-2-decenoyl-[acyl-carrier protein] isomerase
MDSLIYSQNLIFDKEALLRCAHGELFHPDSPRLPTHPLLMLDRVTHISASGGLHGKGEIIGELDIHPDLWFFAGHFVGDRVMPGCLALDGMWQLLGFWLAWQGFRGRGRALTGSMSCAAPVLPEMQTVFYHVHIKRLVARSRVMAMGDGALLCSRNNTICNFENLKVALIQYPATFDLPITHCAARR